MSEDICGRTAKSTGEPCTRPAGWGTDNDSGACKFHGGASGGGAREGAGAPEQNTNAVSHGAYADCNSFYQDVLNDSLRQLTDGIFTDYMEQYKTLHGTPPLGHETELFRISVTHVKDIVLDNWATDRPRSLETQNPLVEEETEKKFVEGAGPVDHNTYKESVVLAAQKKLSTDRRQWLKDLGLLEDPESQKADAIAGGIDLTFTAEEKQRHVEENDVEPDI